MRLCETTDGGLVSELRKRSINAQVAGVVRSGAPVRRLVGVDRVQLRVLGPLEVVHRDRVTEMARARPRELLALFATRPNRSISPQRLIDELWDGNPPPTATSALRVHIAHVRRVLEPERVHGPSDRLALESGDYMLRVDSCELDSLRFEELVSSGRESSQRGDARFAEECLGAALQCWRGSAFPDIRGLSAAQGAIARLEQLRTAAIEELADLRLALGSPETVIELLVNAVDEYPLNEHLTGQLMLALYRAGRQAEALRAFANLARKLDDELGLKPCPEICHLEEDILLQRRDLDLLSRPSPSIALVSARPEPARFIGRRPQLARLLAQHDEARSPNRRLALVSGPAGIGKTALVTEYVARAQRAGAIVMVGQCQPPPQRGYGAIGQAISALMSRGSPDEAVVEVLSFMRGAGSGTQRPGETAAGATTDLSSDVLELFQSIATVIRSLQSAPVVLVIEDLHWADKATIRVLRHLLRDPGLDHLFIVVTYRDDELDFERAERIERLAPPMQVERLHIEGLDHHEVRALIRATATPLAIPVLLDLATTITDATGGNPFYLRALLTEVDDTVATEPDRREIETAIETLAPAGVRALLSHRLNRLSIDSIFVLQAAATIGRGISAALLTDTCELSAGAIHEAIEELLDNRLLFEDDWHVDHFEFAHALVRSTVYSTIAHEERAQLHLRVAEALETCCSRLEPPHSGEIAHHYLAAVPLADAGKAADWSSRAGKESADALAFAEAAAWYEQALQCWVAADRPVAAAGQLEFALGRAYEADHQFARAREMFLSGAEHALNSRDISLLADLAVAANGPWTSGLDDRAQTQGLLETALLEVGPDHPARRLNLLTSLARSLYYLDSAREGHLVEEALELAITLNDTADLSDAKLAQHLWLSHYPEARRDRLNIADETMHLATDSCSPRLQLHAARELLTDLLENAELERFNTALADYERLANEHSSPRDIYWSMALRATQATLRGDLGAAEQLARGAQLRGRELYQESRGAELLQRVVIRFQQGRLAEEVAVLRPAARAQTLYRAGSCLAALACAETGRARQGVRIARWAVGPDGRGISRDAFWLAAHALFASVAATAHDVELAELIAELISPYADHVVVFGAGGAVLGSGHHWLGLLSSVGEQWDAAAEHFAEAEHISWLLEAPYWRAQAQIDRAYALQHRGRRGDPDVAQQCIDAAVSCAETHGYGRLLVRATKMM